MSPEGIPDSLSETAANDAGVLRYVRQGPNVRLILNYRHGPKTATLSEESESEVTRALDRLRAEAVAEMERTLGELLAILAQKLPEDEGGEKEFVDPQFADAPLVAVARREQTHLSIAIPPYYAEIIDPHAAEIPDRFLAEEYVRAVIRNRTIHLLGEFEHARRNLLEDLRYPPRDPRNP